MARLDPIKGGHHTMTSKKYKKRLINGGKLCNICNEVRKMDEYYRNQSYCKFCSSDMNKARNKKNKFKLW